MKTLIELAAMDCKPLVGKGHLLEDAVLATGLSVLPGWVSEGRTIRKTFKFADYYHTMGFVNAVASVAHRQDHHPDMTVGYDKVVVALSTHSAGPIGSGGGVTMNDLICAAHIERLVQP